MKSVERRECHRVSHREYLPIYLTNLDLDETNRNGGVVGGGGGEHVATKESGTVSVQVQRGGDPSPPGLVAAAQGQHHQGSTRPDLLATHLHYTICIHPAQLTNNTVSQQTTH